MSMQSILGIEIEIKIGESARKFELYKFDALSNGHG
jgi:hypothetical protein